MKVYDELKTQELLKNLKADGIEVKDLSALFCKKVIGVKLKAGRGRMTLAVDDLEDLGLKNNTTDAEAKKFKKENISAGAFKFFKKEIISGFDNLIGNTRQAIYRYSVSNDGTTYYMTEKSYKEFKDVFNSKYLSKFNKLKENLLNDYDNSKDDFKKGFEKWLISLGIDESEVNLRVKENVSKFPTKDEIERTCNMSYFTVAYPIFSEKNLEGVSGDIATDLLADRDCSSIETYYNMIGFGLSRLYEITAKMIETIDISTKEKEEAPLNTQIASRTKGLFNQTINELKDSNSLLKNDKLGALLNILSRIYIDKKTNDDETITNSQAIKDSENILAATYGYAKYLGIQDMLSEVVKGSDFDIDELELLSESIEISEL